MFRGRQTPPFRGKKSRDGIQNEGVIDVANDTVESAEDVFQVIERAAAFVPVDRIFPYTNCGMAPMKYDLAFAKLEALAAGARLARERLG